MQIKTKGFDLHPAQNFVINKGYQRIKRIIKYLPEDLVVFNVVISCHHQKSPVFTTHFYLDTPNGKFSSMASSRKFHLSVGESVDRIMRQLRKKKTVLLNKRII